jgi:hypothetical protein
MIIMYNWQQITQPLIRIQDIVKEGGRRGGFNKDQEGNLIRYKSVHCANAV